MPGDELAGAGECAAQPGGSPTVAILGATGKTGKWAMKGALQRGWTVRALARSPAKLEPVLKEVFPDKSEADVKALLGAVTVVQGSATDQEKLAELCAGATAVMSFLGMVKPPDPIVQPSVAAVIAAMKTLPQPPKFISMSSISLGDSRAQGTKAWGCCVRWLVADHTAKSCFRDLQAAEDYILANRSGLNVTIGRATVLGDKKGYLKDYTDAKKSYALKAADDCQGLTFKVDRQHVAEAFLDLCLSSDWDNKEVSIFNTK